LRGWLEGADRRKRREVDGKTLSGEKLRHDAGGARSQQNSVPVVSCSKKTVGVAGDGAQHRKIVCCGRAKTGPGLKLRSIGNGWEQVGGERAKTGDVFGNDCLVEAGVFDGGSDNGRCSHVRSCPGNYIDVGRSEDDVERERAWKLNGDHLAFARNNPS